MNRVFPLSFLYDSRFERKVIGVFLVYFIFQKGAKTKLIKDKRICEKNQSKFLNGGLHKVNYQLFTVTYGSRYSRMDQVKLAEDGL